ncbi:MAG: hypothetical protein KAT71_04565 [Gammaproteobacteria bacterium]|nr:hypothetical protein [Gammaproteobacteria bacterium]
MNKKLLITLLTCAGCAVLTLSGCSSSKNSGKNFFAVNKPTDQHTICSQLKREMIFYNSDTNMNPQWSSPTKKAQLLQEYKKYNCEQQEKKKQQQKQQTKTTS